MILPLVAISAVAAPKDGRYRLQLYTTGDVHGNYFDAQYAGDGVHGSLMSVSAYVSNARREFGADNVILLDAGDFLQGDNAAYYYNYVDTLSTHVYADLSAEIGYDAVVVGNHDIETGPSVYKRMQHQLKMPFLAANAVDMTTRKPCFDEYAIIERGGLRVAIIGFTNPSMRTWLAEDKLSGMDFIDPMNGFAQELVDRVRREEHPDVVIVAIHAGSGPGDGSAKENQGRDLLYALRGVDIVVSAHDHRPYNETFHGAVLVNSGSHCKTMGHAEIEIEVSSGKVVSKNISASTVALDPFSVDKNLSERYGSRYEAVKEFSLREIGYLKMPLCTNDAFTGMCDYLNFVHTVCLEATGADICFAAPLKFNGRVESGRVVYNDLFTIYPYENQLFVLEMTGREIKDYLEESYDRWINTVPCGSQGNLLKITNVPDPRTDRDSWSFVNRSYNFDSASGIDYTVDVTAQKGSRIVVSSMADGSAFNMDAVYRVATTSYRANGGGNLLAAVGIADTDSRIIARDKEIRDMVYDYFLAHPVVDPSLVGDCKRIGRWSFVPFDHAAPLFEIDMNLLFGITSSR